MLRVRFTAQDLLHIRFASRPAPLMELGLAAATLQRADSTEVFGSWRARVRRALPEQARPLFDLVPPNGAGPQFLDPLDPGFDAGLDRVLAAPQGSVVPELQRVCPAYRPITPWVRALAEQDRDAWRTLEHAVRAGHRVLVDEQWTRILASYTADLTWRTTLLRERGTGAVLASLYPGSTWTGSTLQIPYPTEARIRLAGRGLTLMPSSVWTGSPLIGQDENGGDLLLYPALTPLPLIEPQPGPDPLQTLLGSTRAAVLRAARNPQTTSSIAADLQISAASASAHTKTLRANGLLTSTRDGKQVWHTITPLGRTLLS